MTRPADRRFAVELRPNACGQGWHAVIFEGWLYVAAIAFDRDEAFRLALEAYRADRAVRRVAWREARKKLN